MLEKIFGSRARVKILKIFLMNNNEKFYIRQLSRDLKLQVNSVRRELRNLEEFGLLTANNNIKSKNSKEVQGIDDMDKSKESENNLTLKVNGLNDKKYYFLNKNFILYTEIKSLMIKSQILSGEGFIKKLKLFCEPKFILLTGMFLNNEASLTDVLIVANIEQVKLLKIIQDLESELNKEVRFTVLSEEEFRYRQEVADVFLHNILNGKKIVLVDNFLEVKS